jgi:hypothetical protein
MFVALFKQSRCQRKNWEWPEKRACKSVAQEENQKNAQVDRGQTIKWEIRFIGTTRLVSLFGSSRTS